MSIINITLAMELKIPLILDWILIYVKIYVLFTNLQQPCPCEYLPAILID